jgi:hypothetical protein
MSEEPKMEKTLADVNSELSKAFDDLRAGRITIAESHAIGKDADKVLKRKAEELRRLKKAARKS